jgi:hypothetical protein
MKFGEPNDPLRQSIVWCMIRPMFARVRSVPALLILSVLAFGLALLIGCGGGGGGGGVTHPTNQITPGYVLYGISTSTPPALAPGDQVTLTASATIDGVTSPLTPYNFAVRGGAPVGTVSPAGVLTAGSGITAGSTYVISANSSLGEVSWTFTAAAPLSSPVIIGFVECNATGSAGVGGASITAYDSHGNVVGTATSAANGTFSMSVTSAATQFGVTTGGVNISDVTLTNQFEYGTAQYTTTNPQCLPPLPALTAGNKHYPLTNPIVLEAATFDGSSQPPPPPPGCFQ